MDFFKKHKCVTSHHTSLLLRIVPHPDTVLCSMARALSCMCCSFRAQLITFNMQPKWFF